jgi:hypothetical protein
MKGAFNSFHFHHYRLSGEAASAGREKLDSDISDKAALK